MLAQKQSLYHGETLEIGDVRGLREAALRRVSAR
jgi:hypothetical protein